MRILIVDCLEWTESDYGGEYACDAGQWFVEALGGDESRFLIWRAWEETRPPEACDGVVIGGSRASVYDEQPWIGRLMGQVRE